VLAIRMTSGMRALSKIFKAAGTFLTALLVSLK
jgi:hypothetical protein